jgi:hypothetical protein
MQPTLTSFTPYFIAMKGEISFATHIPTHTQHGTALISTTAWQINSLRFFNVLHFDLLLLLLAANNPLWHVQENVMYL